MAKRKESLIFALAVRENVWEPLRRSGNYEREIFISIKNAILVHMDQKLEILNYINGERLDLLEELAETEATLHETTAALSAGDLSTVIVNYTFQ